VNGLFQSTQQLTTSAIASEYFVNQSKLSNLYCRRAASCPSTHFKPVPRRRLRTCTTQATRERRLRTCLQIFCILATGVSINPQREKTAERRIWEEKSIQII